MKRKRIFIQNEPLWLVESSFIALLAFGAQLFSIVSFIVELSNGFKNIDRFLGYYLTFLLAPFIVYPMVFSMFSWNVHIDEKKSG